MPFNLTINGVTVQVDNINVMMNSVTATVEHLCVGQDEVWSSGSQRLPSEISLTLTDWFQFGVYGTQSAANAVTVDWGDGSQPETTGNLEVELEHTYAASGNYTVTILVSDGETFTIGDSSYQGISSITSVTIGDGIIGIGQSAFSQSSVQSVNNVSDDLELINLGCFASCTSLTSVVLGAGMGGQSTQQITASSFSSCTSLMSITCRATEPPKLGRYALQNVPADCAIYVPAASVAAYQAAIGWSARAAYIQAIPA